MRGNEIEIFKSAGRDLLRLPPPPPNVGLSVFSSPVIIIETKSRVDRPAS